MKGKTILVLGATGYIGSQLVARLIEEGYGVRCLVRDRKKIETRVWSDDIEIFEGDILAPDSLDKAFRDVDTVYYLVHSMAAPGGDFAKLDRKAARYAGEAAKKAGVGRIIYLGGLGRRDLQPSEHLKSRHEVGDILRSSGVPVTEFRAAVIIGAGSLSFELIHHLTNRLPVMICPRWVITRTQPISVRDVLDYLTAALENPESKNKVIDIGGPEILTYRDMILTVAKVLGLRRWLIKVPVLTPRLSSYWVKLVTPIPVKPARALIEGLRHETIRENNEADRLFAIQPEPFEAAVRKALTAVIPGEIIPEKGKAASIIMQIEPSHLLKNRRQVTVGAPAEHVFSVVSAIGGDNGWYYANWLWRLRGLIDKFFGGVGLRRSGRGEAVLAVGQTLDFWRIEEVEDEKRLLLRAEMKVPGNAWLEFEVQPLDARRSILIQTARFYPRGLAGIFYWYGIYPFHAIVFRGLAAAIAKRAKEVTVK